MNDYEMCISFGKSMERPEVPLPTTGSFKGILIQVYAGV